MNADKRRKIKAVRWFMPITGKVDEAVPARHRLLVFIGVHRRSSAVPLS
ncbi:MAG: hypothetical protein HYU73_22345 [Betaproteobacteria bacterium]|nr:hypothetical protein [Betaproteobacteria bacterium]